MGTDRIARILAIHQRLQSGSPRVEDLAAEFGVCRRTIFRDLRSVQQATNGSSDDNGHATSTDGRTSRAGAPAQLQAVLCYLATSPWGPALSAELNALSRSILKLLPVAEQREFRRYARAFAPLKPLIGRSGIPFLTLMEGLALGTPVMLKRKGETMHRARIPVRLLLANGNVYLVMRQGRSRVERKMRLEEVLGAMAGLESTPQHGDPPTSEPLNSPTLLRHDRSRTEAPFE